MGKIQKLSPELINLIAAGEVVERPASVVKELVENSIDAGAATVTVKIENGGVDLIQVIDDGEGMDEADAKLAFTQHATSKISESKDLDHINSLGFRGEALASISSVADITLETKTVDTEALRIEIRDQQLEVGKSGQADPGTKLSIKKLFSKVPGRRKFLRRPSTEFNHIQNIFIAIALTHLGVHFELYHNGGLTYRLPKVVNQAERIAEIWRNISVDDLYLREGSGNNNQITAWVGKPDVARKDRTRQFIFVNGRSISDRLIQRAVQDAFKGFIHRDLQPVYFITLEIPADQVDVNVHPRKQEVKFHFGSQIYSLVHNTVRSLLEQQTKSDISDITSRGTITGNSEGAGSVSQPELNLDSKPASKSGSKKYPNIQTGMNFTKHMLKAPQTNYGSSRQGSSSIATPNFESRSSESREFASSESASPNTGLDVRPFQVFNTYIVYPQGDNLVFIDQHAAAEKVLYEKLMRQIDKAASIKMLVPEVIELSSQEHEQVLARKDKLAQIGLEIADFGDSTIQVIAKPEHTPNLHTGEFLQAFLQDTQDFDDNDELLAEIGNNDLHYLVATAACHGSIRAGQPLKAAEMWQIVNDLNECKYPYNCPHGRPVSWVLSRTELEKNFKRII